MKSESGSDLLSDSTGQKGSVTVSLVSHLQADIAFRLVGDLADYPEIAKIIFVQNLPEELPPLPPGLDASKFQLIKNAAPQGFGSNHNTAFRHCETPFFCVLNPDIRLPSNPFPRLLETLSNSEVGLCVPSVLNVDGQLEDSSRKFPTPFGIMLKVLKISDGSYRYSADSPPFSPDWVGGMFMLIRSTCFRQLGGFDEKFYLYYEDVDLCTRLRKNGFGITLLPGIQALHAAHRTSHRNFKYLRWHLKSMFRYFRKHWLRFPPSAN